MAGKIIYYYENGRLPLGVILSAFPDEINEIVPSVIRKLEDELRPYEEARTMKAYYAMTAGLPAWFANKRGEEEVPKWKARLLKDSRWLMKSKYRIDGIGGKPNSRAVLPVEIVKQIPIVELHAFENLKKKGNKYSASCPFHSDKTPSFLINDQNRFYCFSCQATGDGIELIKKLHNLDFISAVKLMQGLSRQ